ncbi:claudin-10 [Megalops cyprinoides]|uniref:claudin-10 n=1 Tax=Megalops cyprinoides TaxID=118141 RepID=UPI001864CF70|nr:claudin-10 [Megalops cyprinoides]
MRKRLFQILGFLVSTLGWVFVSCTMAMDYWRVSQIGGQGGSFIIKVAWYWSNLWKDCFIDSTAVVNCRDYAVLWSVTPYIQGVRGLLMVGLGLGFVGAILAFVGMECTYIGGSDKIKDKILFAAAVFHFVGGISDISGYCLYINRIARTAFNPNLDPTSLRYDIGTPLFLGLVGAFLILVGAVFYVVTVFRVIFPESKVVYAYTSRSYATPRNRSKSLYTGYYRSSRQSRMSRQSRKSMESSSSKSSELSKISQITAEEISDRDAFV